MHRNIHLLPVTTATIRVKILSEVLFWEEFWNPLREKNYVFYFILINNQLHYGCILSLEFMAKPRIQLTQNMSVPMHWL